MDFGLNFSSWSRKAVRDLVSKLFHITVAVRTIGDYLDRWNFTPQKPAKKARQRDEEKVADYFDNQFSIIKQMAEDDEAIIYYADETSINTEDFKRASYSPVGITPTVTVTGTRLKVNIISAISNVGIMRFMTYLCSMNCKIFIQLLKRLVASSNGTKIYLIGDNLKVHHGKMVRKWLEDHSDQIATCYIPPYCPDLNPDKYLNNIMKQMFHSLAQPNNSEELRQQMNQILRNLQNNPELIKSIFQHQKVKYAA
jgi:transposase